ncbi:MAG TPA: glycerol-3-phosphate dehydrogenase [Aquabacterium sp.]|nr:glycerol-3-phosphate dehydrogenase [Aquabacterium sp.]
MMARPALHCDVLVIGGGINGAGIARDLAGRGWQVLLCEQDDLARHTSSASTKLIHGGLRYLEYGEFGLVRKALQERERLLRSAPHIMAPMRFVLPHDAGMRPAWLIRLGLWLYDHLAPRAFLPGCERVALDRSPLGAPLQPGWRDGFVYSDGWVDDARLVVLCALDAAERGARILTRTACEQLVPDGAGWRATLRQRDASGQSHAGAVQTVHARLVVNAAGPWAESVLRQGMGVTGPLRHLRLVKGSHIVVPRCAGHDHAYLFQGQDRRVVFAIPYEAAYTLIGTTDVEFQGDPAQVRIEAHEVSYLCDTVSRYLRQPVTPADVCWTYAGVRPLLDDEQGAAAAVTRDYLLQAERTPAPWLTVWGGKLTTFRVLAEQAADQIGTLLGATRPAWTRDAVLPGGDLIASAPGPALAPPQAWAVFEAGLRARYPWLAPEVLQRVGHAYGSRLHRWLGEASGAADLGIEVAPGLFEAELRYLMREEWARSADDVLWRRSKLGLHYSPAQRQAVADWLAVQARPSAG